MTERRGDQGFSVAPSRVDGTGGGWRGRRRRLTTWLVLAAAAAVIVVAVLGPSLQERPSFDLSYLATPTPATRPSPTPTLRPGATPAVTPLPSLLRGVGPIPPGTIAVQTDVFRVLDPAAGTVTEGAALNYGQAAVLRSADQRGWICICLVDDVVDRVLSRTVRLVDIDETGEQSSFRDVVVLGSLEGSPDGPPALTNSLDTTDDGSLAILAIARRGAGETFEFSVAGLSLDERRVSPLASIGTATAPTPSAGPGPSSSSTPGLPRFQLYVDGPYIRVAPDGATAFVWARIQREVYEGPSPTTVVAWRLDLRPDGSVAGVAEAPALAAMPPYCESAGFVTADRFAWFCLLGDQNGASSPPTWALQLFGLDGRDAGRISVPVAGPRYLGEPLFDRANGVAYAWDPVGLTLYRFDIRRLSFERVVFDPAAEVSSGLPPGGGSARPDWHDADSALFPFGYGEIAAAADGSRMYVIGFGEQAPPDAQSQPTLGIFVVDRATLALVDRWAPATNYQTLAMTLDDRAVAAASFAGAAVDGGPAPWESALTLHDVTDGRVMALFGRLGQGLAPLVIER